MRPLDFLRTRLVTLIGRSTPTCREITRLLSRALDEPLPLRTRIRVRLHLAICALCERYARQLRFLRRAAGRVEEQEECLPPATLPPEARTRIRETLRAGRRKTPPGPA